MAKPASLPATRSPPSTMPNLPLMAFCYRSGKDGRGGSSCRGRHLRRSNAEAAVCGARVQKPPPAAPDCGYCRGRRLWRSIAEVTVHAARLRKLQRLPFMAGRLRNPRHTVRGTISITCGYVPASIVPFPFPPHTPTSFCHKRHPLRHKRQPLHFFAINGSLRSRALQTAVSASAENTHREVDEEARAAAPGPSTRRRKKRVRGDFPLLGIARRGPS